jgi:chromosome segregation ATPase
MKLKFLLIPLAMATFASFPGQARAADDFRLLRLPGGVAEGPRFQAERERIRDAMNARDAEIKQVEGYIQASAAALARHRQEVDGLRAQMVESQVGTTPQNMSQKQARLIELTQQMQALTAQDITYERGVADNQGRREALLSEKRALVAEYRLIRQGVIDSARNGVKIAKFDNMLFEAGQGISCSIERTQAKLDHELTIPFPKIDTSKDFAGAAR